MTLRRAGGCLALVVALVCGGTAQSSVQGDKQFQAALHTEMVDGDLRAAIEEYRAIAVRPGVAREVAATALVRMAECYHKLGSAESRPIYERVVREFAEQKEAVSIAQARLAGAPTGQQHAVSLRKVWDGRTSGLTAAVLTMVSQDGRRLSYTPWAAATANVHEPVTGTDRSVAQSHGGPSVISRDGRQVAYEWYGDPNGSELRITNIEDTGTGASAFRRLYASSDVAEITPMDFSPDGRSLAV
jgi:hypothetical protein